MEFKFERVQSTVYPAYLHIGGYSIALDPELIHALKGCAGLEATKFLEALIARIGSNRYLKEMIQEGWSQTEDATALAERLGTELRSLPRH